MAQSTIPNSCPLLSIASHHRNRSAMRIFLREIQRLFQTPHLVFVDPVLDAFGIVMDMIWRIRRAFGEITFPKPVIADDFLRATTSFGREQHARSPAGPHRVAATDQSLRPLFGRGKG